MFTFGKKPQSPVTDKGFTQSDIDNAVYKAKQEQKKDFDMEKKELEHKHKLELSENEFKMKHLADERVKKAEDESTLLRQEVAVLKKENEMLGKITDLNGDVIDVKKLVEDLINKLPNVNITAGLATGPAAKPAKE